eukprot:63139-Prymnesium_polylepis.1
MDMLCACVWRALCICMLVAAQGAGAAAWQAACACKSVSVGVRWSAHCGWARENAGVRARLAVSRAPTAPVALSHGCFDTVACVR